MDERGSGECEKDGGGMHRLVGEVVVMGDEDGIVKLIVEMMEDESMERALGVVFVPARTGEKNYITQLLLHLSK